MAEKTRDQLIARVLKLLTVVGSGQSPSAEDYDSVNDEIDTILADLSVRSILDVADPEEFDEDIFQALALRIACAVASDFSVNTISGYPGMSVEEVARFAESRLRVIRSSGPTYETLKTTYY